MNDPTGRANGARLLPQPSQSLFGVTMRTVAYKVVSSAAVAGATVVTARQLGPTGRGVLVLYLAVASFTLLLVSLGVNTSARLLLVDAVQPIPLGHFLGLAWVLVAAQFILCGVVGAVLLVLVDVHVGTTGVVLLGLLGASLLGQYLLFDTMNAYGLISTGAAIEGAGGVAQLIGVLALAALRTRRVEPFVLMVSAAHLGQVVADSIVLRRRNLSLRPRYDREAWRRLVHLGLPGVVVNVGQLLAFRVDRYLVGLFLTPAAVGVYSVASTAPELLRLPTMALGQPIFHRLAAGEARLEDFRRSRAACILITTALAAVTACAAPFVVRTVFGAQFAGAVTPMRILLLAELGIAVYYLDGSALFGLGRIGDVATAAVVGLVVVAAADLLLVPALGIAGAAWASVPAYSAMGLVAYRRSFRTLPSSSRRGAQNEAERRRSPQA